MAIETTRLQQLSWMQNYIYFDIKRYKEYNIPIIENKALAKDLYDTTEVGQEIPPELYQAVAEVLASVYRARERQAV